MVKGKFDSAHYLPDYDGKCKNIHGHTWHITAGFKYEQLYDDGSKTGMGEDFTVLKQQWKALEMSFDHRMIGKAIVCENCGHSAVDVQSIGFDEVATAENIAKQIFDAWESMNKHIVWIEVWETEGAGVRYEP